MVSSPPPPFAGTPATPLHLLSQASWGHTSLPAAVAIAAGTTQEKKTEMSIFFSLLPLTRQWRPRCRVHLPSRSHWLPHCICRHTPRGSPAPNSTSSAPPCPPLAHRSPAPPNPLNSKISFSFSFSFFYFISNRCRTMWSPSSPHAHSGHRRNRCCCTCAGPVACTMY